MEVLGWGLPVIAPNIPQWLAWLLVIGGAFLIVGGAFTWLRLQRFIPTPLWLGRRLWPMAMWWKYPPQVRLLTDPHIEYQVLDGRAKQCEMHIQVFVRNCLPSGVLRISQGSGRVRVKQRRFRKKQTYYFHSIAPSEMALIPGGYHVFNFIFRWEHIGQVESVGPKLDNRFTWTLSNIRAEFEGRYNFARMLPKIGQEHLAPEI